MDSNKEDRELTPAERYEEQAAAWEAEKKRRAAWGPLKRAWEWQKDLAAEHGVLLYIMVGIVGLVLLYTLVHFIVN